MDTEVEHMLLGLPTQARKVMLTETSNGGCVNLDLRIPSIPLSPEASPPGTPQNTNGRFYARVPVAKGDFSDGNSTVLISPRTCAGGSPCPQVAGLMVAKIIPSGTRLGPFKAVGSERGVFL